MSPVRFWARRPALSRISSSAASTRRDMSAAKQRNSALAHVVFVCLHNAGRSQMSQGLVEQAADGRHTAASAGTTPGERVHPAVVEVMRELGIVSRTAAPVAHARARRAGRRRCDDGLRRPMPVHSRQALHRPGAPGPNRAPGRRGSRHPRRNRPPACSSCSPSWTLLSSCARIRSYLAGLSVRGADGSAPRLLWDSCSVGGESSRCG